LRFSQVSGCETVSSVRNASASRGVAKKILAFRKHPGKTSPDCGESRDGRVVNRLSCQEQPVLSAWNTLRAPFIAPPAICSRASGEIASVAETTSSQTLSVPEIQSHRVKPADLSSWEFSTQALSSEAAPSLLSLSCCPSLSP